MRKLKLCSLELINVPYKSQLTRAGEFQGWKCLLFSVLFYISSACQEKGTEQGSQITAYSLDTVIIDSKDRILDLSGYMQRTDLNTDERSFFLYNRHDHSIDEINLDRKTFVRSFPLDAEGPNGVGQYIFALQSLKDNLLFLKSIPFSSVIDKSGRVVQKVNWLSAKDSLGGPFGDVPPRTELIVDIEDWRVVGTNLDFMKETAFLGVFSVLDNRVKNIDIDSKNSFSGYFLKAGTNFRPPWVYLTSDDNHIYVTHEYSNEIILFNPAGELVKVVDYEPKLTPKRPKLPEILNGTREQIRKEQRKLGEQVYFQPPVWDKVNRRYFRLSAQWIYGDGSDETASFPKARVFLSVLDAEFDLVGEVELKELFSANYKYFAKDGKLWVSQNFSDELGFFVFDL
ncbi:DUF4221 family protein [Cyclobacterium jeungdonense]|uniref:DUF4221 family protein n=1 Tax=Cyclobacterium jeungdonense TaxID=708087 RepID=A0ABT8C723_9BACT|nr:DUF4221 family protein [Cyclobacterium jeungdonense]MDN3688564.1 DUF4221 family protein [Cyclobacterium jeungdonense]